MKFLRIFCQDNFARLPSETAACLKNKYQNGRKNRNVTKTRKNTENFIPWKLPFIWSKSTLMLLKMNARTHTHAPLHTHIYIGGGEGVSTLIRAHAHTRANIHIRKCVQGILKENYNCSIDLLFDWFGLVCFANKNNNCQLSNSWFQTSQTGDQWYSDTSPFSIPCIHTRTHTQTHTCR
jgi:hypothetical protein